MRSFVVKMELSPHSEAPRRRVLVRDRSMRYVYVTLTTPEINRAMGRDRTAYFRAQARDDADGVQLIIGVRTEVQDW